MQSQRASADVIWRGGATRGSQSRPAETSERITVRAAQPLWLRNNGQLRGALLERDRPLSIGLIRIESGSRR